MIGFLIYLPAGLLGLLLGKSASKAAAIGAITQIAIIGFLASNGAFNSATLDNDQLVVSVLVSLAFGAFAGAIGCTIRRIVSALWNNPSEVGEIVGGSLMVVAMVGLQIALAGSYLFAIWTDVKRGNTAYFIADLLIPPFGIIRGALMWFGVL